MGTKHRQTKQDEYSFNLSKTLGCTNLIAVYHTVIRSPDYMNQLLDDPNWKKLSFVFYIIKGSLNIAKNDAFITIPENNVIFGETGTDVYLTDNDNDAEFACFYFQIFNHSLPLFYPYKVTARDLSPTLNDIISNLKHQDSLSYSYANALFGSLLFSWLKEIQVNKITSVPQAHIIYQAEMYINEHADEKLLVSDLARNFHFSEKHFRQLFTKIIGMQPKKYIENVKMETAYNLLINTDLSIDEISDKLSFSSSHHFTNAFKNLYGLPPSAYRNKK